MALVEHFLTIQFSKHIFFHNKYGVARSYDPLIDTVRFYFYPVVLVGISIGELGISTTRYYKYGDPISLSMALSEFWQKHYAISAKCGEVYGKPDVLIIDHRCKDSIMPEFYTWLEDNQVDFQFSTTAPKPTKLYSHHQKSPYIYDAPAKKGEALSLEKINNRFYSYMDVYETAKNRDTLNRYVEIRAPFVDQGTSCSNEVNEKQLIIRPLKTDKMMTDPQWIEATTRSYGYLVNNYESQQIDDLRGNERTLFKLLLKVREMEWENILPGLEDTLKAFKDSNYQDTSLFDENDYDFAFNELLYKYCTTFNITKLNRTELQELASEIIFADAELICAAELNFAQKSEKKSKLYVIRREFEDDIYLISRDNSRVNKWLQKDIFDLTENGYFSVDMDDVEVGYNAESLINDIVQFPDNRSILSTAVAKKLDLLLYNLDPLD